MSHHIIRGQRIDPDKLTLAKDLRRNMTPAERALWEAVRGNQLAGLHFRRQQIISGFIVDFYCHAARLVVEVDGPVHDQQAEHDADRSRILESLGLRVLRFSNDAVMENLPGVLQVIRAAC